MRRLRRPTVTLPKLRRRAAELLWQYRKERAAPGRLQGHWREPEVRGALLAMHGPVCAWCQRSLLEDKGEVDHFRPTALYWWLAYDFTNYLLSCSACNPRKSKAFPLLEAWRCTWPERRRLHEERHELLDPVMDDVESWFRVRYQNRHFRLIPADSLRPGTEELRRADATLALFQWNEDVRLVNARKEAIRRALRSARSAAQGDRIKTVEVKRLASRFQPFGAAIRQLLAGKYPWLLPAPAEELLLFVKYLTQQLDLAHRLRLEKPGSATTKRDETEILWALAVLWKDPPHVSPGEIERWLEKLGCRDQVSALLAQL
jgi:uncharacterized protein (TIGR02646 family)